MPRPSNLDDPRLASYAWARYWRLMRWMGLFTGFAVLAALAFLYSQFGMVSIHMYIAAGLGIGIMVLLTAALMGLVFMSSGTGHDEAIDDPYDYAPPHGKDDD